MPLRNGIEALNELAGKTAEGARESRRGLGGSSRVQRVAEIQARHAAFLDAAKDTYERVLDATADDDKRNACNAAYRTTVTKADYARDEEVAAATAREAIEKDAAYREYRASPGYMGE